MSQDNNTSKSGPDTEPDEKIILSIQTIDLLFKAGEISSAIHHRLRNLPRLKQIEKLNEETIPLYNGWQNKPTWLVNLWLSNESIKHNMVLEWASDLRKDEEETDKIRILADRIKEYVEKRTLHGDHQDWGLTNDLFGWALAYVYWEDIARSYLTTAKELEEYKKKWKC